MPLSDTTRLVPIRTVCAMYSLNPNTLRTWERRYGVVKPRRSDGGHRGYGDEDLAAIEGMLGLLANGLSPADAARNLGSTANGRLNHAAAAMDPVVREARMTFRHAVKTMDQTAMHRAVAATASRMGYEAAVESVLFPELSYWGHRWSLSGADIAREHLATLAAKAFMLRTLTEAMNPDAAPSSPAVVLACAPGEQHDLPIHHVANLLARAGAARPMVLTGGLPVAETLKAAEMSGAAALVLSCTVSPRPDVLREWVGEIIDGGWESRAILVGSGFTRSRIFSETKVRSAPGGYAQVMNVLRRMAAEQAA